MLKSNPLRGDTFPRTMSIFSSSMKWLSGAISGSPRSNRPLKVEIVSERCPSIMLHLLQHVADGHIDTSCAAHRTTCATNGNSSVDVIGNERSSVSENRCARQTQVAKCATSELCKRGDEQVDR